MQFIVKVIGSNSILALAPEIGLSIVGGGKNPPSVPTAVQTKLYSFRFDCKIVSFTAANTNLIFSVSKMKNIWEKSFISHLSIYNQDM